MSDEQDVFAAGSVTEAFESAPEGAGDIDYFATSSLAVPPAIPDAHQGVITSVTVKRYDNEKETVAVIVGLQSTNVPSLEVTYDVFMPKGFVDDINVDASTLPDEEGNKQQTQFRIAVANNDGTATLQELRTLAKDAGRTSAGVGITARAQTFDELIENHNKLLTGLEVVFLRRPDGGDDPRYKNRLKVRNILNAQTAFDPKKIKPWNGKVGAGSKGYKRMWEQENQ